MTYSTGSQEVLTALLVGVQLPGVSDSEHRNSMKELARLVTTLGYRVIGEFSQRRDSTRGADVLGEGKLKELARWTGGPGFVSSRFQAKKSKAALKFSSASNSSVSDPTEKGSDRSSDINSEMTDGELSDVENNEPNQISLTELAQVVVFDCDLSPSQHRNLESATGAQIIDRTGVIIEIFSRHARTRSARLQVEIARLTYVAPRLRETGGGADRQGGGVGAKGAGETSLELDKRRIRDRIKELRTEIESLSKEQITRRSRRENENCVALVGYTNAGKSSLMRALTGSDVLIANKLFATLDTTVRALSPETQPKILISDTVGFIKKLPHDLVASFKSTLDEVLNANLLLFVVDASDHDFRSQLLVTQSVLAEVGASEIPHFLVLNKKDCLTKSQIEELQREFPESPIISTRDAEDLSLLRENILSFFTKEMVEADFSVPYTVQGILGDIRASLIVLSENYDEVGVRLRVRGNSIDLKRIKEKLIDRLKAPS